jgi:uncharacterized protein (DUF2267 family)
VTIAAADRHRQPEGMADIRDTHQVVQSRRERPEDDSFDAFLDEIRFTARGPRVEPRDAAEAVTCTLAQRLAGRTVEDMERDLTPGIADLVRTCDRHEGPARAHRIGRREFEQDVADHLGIDRGGAEVIVMDVFTALRDRLPERDAERVAAQLPADLADLFRRPV